MFISMYTHMGLNFSYIWAIYVYIKIAILSARNASGKKNKDHCLQVTSRLQDRQIIKNKHNHKVNYRL